MAARPRITITKRYSGVLTGTGVAVTLAAQGADGQGYVASERVVGTLDGRSGSFVVQHGGIAGDGSVRTFGDAVGRRRLTGGSLRINCG